jgi:hypothetical protein
MSAAVSVQRFGENMMARHLVMLAAFLVQPEPPTRPLRPKISTLKHQRGTPF